MKIACRSILFSCMACMCLAGCGGNSTSSTTPTGNTCTGVVITGTLQDSLTKQPISQGVAVLESGTQFSSTTIYNFSPTQQVATDAHGAFKLCTQTVATPSAIVLEALDSAGKAYPPFTASVTGTTDLGTIPMGGCTGACGLLDDQQQTSLPATITGVITSAPIAKTISVVPQYTLSALDGSKTKDGHSILWSLDLPLFNSSPASSFTTASGACAGTAAFCASYSFPIPSQKPIRPFNGGYLQQVGVPDYMIYAVPGGSASCAQPYRYSVLQQDGTSFLVASPGAQITAAEINFTGCQ